MENQVELSTRIQERTFHREGHQDREGRDILIGQERCPIKNPSPFGAVWGGEFFGSNRFSSIGSERPFFVLLAGFVVQSFS